MLISLQNSKTLKLLLLSFSAFFFSSRGKCLEHSGADSDKIKESINEIVINIHIKHRMISCQTDQCLSRTRNSFHTNLIFKLTNLKQCTLMTGRRGRINKLECKAFNFFFYVW